MTDIRILKPEQILHEFPETKFKNGPLYNQPFFCELIKPGKLRFGRLVTEDGMIQFFPFTTDAILWRRRVFILPYCQRFTPFTLNDDLPEEQAINLWTNWLEENTSSCHWTFSANISNGPYALKTNQFLDLSLDTEALLKAWKKGRKTALLKSENLQTRLLTATEFRKELNNLNHQPTGKAWHPDSFEKAAILRISEAHNNEVLVERYGIFEEEKCLNLVLLLKWNNRWHYLFSQSNTRGFELDSLTRFFYFLIEKKAGSPSIFDFEGSSIPGVRAFFNSLGAQEESYFEFRV